MAGDVLPEGLSREPVRNGMSSPTAVGDETGGDQQWQNEAAADVLSEGLSRGPVLDWMSSPTDVGDETGGDQQ